jgi:hypothetical protein
MIVTLRVSAPAVATAGNSLRTAIGRSPVKGTVVRASFYASTTLTGAATNNRTISLLNGGAAGTGTTSVASKNFASGTNATAQSDTVITLSGTAANLEVALGDVLQWDSLAVGTGLADPGGTGEVDIEVDLQL